MGLIVSAHSLRGKSRSALVFRLHSLGLKLHNNGCRANSELGLFIPDAVTHMAMSLFSGYCNYILCLCFSILCLFLIVLKYFYTIKYQNFMIFYTGTLYLQYAISSFVFRRSNICNGINITKEICLVPFLWKHFKVFNDASEK